MDPETVEVLCAAFLVLVLRTHYRGVFAEDDHNGTAPRTNSFPSKT